MIEKGYIRSNNYIMNNTISAIILTYNEEKHIARCINSLRGICEEIFVIDSFSQDRTLEIAKQLGAKVYQNPWKIMQLNLIGE